MTHRELVRENDGQTIELHRGDTLVIKLADNPTTGFRWAIDSFEPTVMARVDEDYSSSSAAIGGGGLRRFAFRAVTSGTSVIELKLWRSWEGDGSVRSRYQVTVRVD